MEQRRWLGGLCVPEWRADPGWGTPEDRKVGRRMAGVLRYGRWEAMEDRALARYLGVGVDQIQRCIAADVRRDGAVRFESGLDDGGRRQGRADAGRGGFLVWAGDHDRLPDCPGGGICRASSEDGLCISERPVGPPRGTGGQLNPLRAKEIYKQLLRMARVDTRTAERRRRQQNEGRGIERAQAMAETRRRNERQGPRGGELEDPGAVEGPPGGRPSNELARFLQRTLGREGLGGVVRPPQDWDVLAEGYGLERLQYYLDERPGLGTGPSCRVWRWCRNGARAHQRYAQERLDLHSLWARQQVIRAEARGDERLEARLAARRGRPSGGRPWRGPRVPGPGIPWTGTPLTRMEVTTAQRGQRRGRQTVRDREVRAPHHRRETRRGGRSRLLRARRRRPVRVCPPRARAGPVLMVWPSRRQWYRWGTRRGCRFGRGMGPATPWVGRAGWRWTMGLRWQSPRRGRVQARRRTSAAESPVGRGSSLQGSWARPTSRRFGRPHLWGGEWPSSSRSRMGYPWRAREDRTTGCLALGARCGRPWRLCPWWGSPLRDSRRGGSWWEHGPG